MEERAILAERAPYRIISGAVHYFRVVPEYWEDRLLKLKACGFNTVETYIAWNVHEPKEEFNFRGMADVVSFIEIAGKLGLHVIVRPSPFICAEWEFGGLPGWSLGYGEIRLRCSDPLYLSKVDHYYDELIPRLVPRCPHTEGRFWRFRSRMNTAVTAMTTLIWNICAQEWCGAALMCFSLLRMGQPTRSLGGTLGDVHATVNFGSGRRIVRQIPGVSRGRTADGHGILERLV